MFSRKGPDGIAIERLARQIDKNKSSFYHLFGDKQYFIEVLLEYHRKQVRELIIEEVKANTIAELADVFVKYADVLLFTRQLRIHQAQGSFGRSYETVVQDSLRDTLPLWGRIIGIENNTYLAELVLRFSLDNFFLQLNESNLTAEWIKQYLSDLHAMIGHITSTKQDGMAQR